MSQKLKKKPSFFSLKRFNSHREKESDEPNTPTTPTPQVQAYSQPLRLSPSAARIANASEKPRKLSAGGIKELVQCSLCVEVLHNPKMLPCQHTFCMACITVYIADAPVIDCPICRTKIQVEGPNFVENLPSNLYIDSLLELVGIRTESPKKPTTTPPSTPTTGVQSVDLFAAGVRCTNCQTMCDSSDVASCQHCKLNFCRVCWSQHLEDMRTQIGSILKQLDSASARLQHKMDHYKDRCERVTEQINITAEEKINAIAATKETLLQEASERQRSADMSALALKSSLDEARMVSAQTMATHASADDKNQVTTFMNLHHNALQLLSEVSKWDADSYVFDKENFRFESDASTPCDAESDDPLPEDARQNNPLESEVSLVQYYRCRNFMPHYIWRKTARPAGIGISPFNDHLYVCGTDCHSVLVVERTQAKIVARLSSDDMLCPVQIAFFKSAGLIYVTDKWKHCIHVFSKEGQYVKCLGQKGSRVGMFRSPEGIAIDNKHNLVYVVDTGNDRVQILHPDGKFVGQIGVVTKALPTNTHTVWDTADVCCTELNVPTSIALTNDRVVILDSGNRRVKVYNKQDRSKILEFGASGQRKGQFKQPEVLTVDPMGFILVGDSGNCRVQVFKPNGQLVRVFGGMGIESGKFGWISGIHVTKELDVIVSDSKNHVVNFF